MEITSFLVIVGRCWAVWLNTNMFVMAIRVDLLLWIGVGPVCAAAVLVYSKLFVDEVSWGQSAG